MIDPAVLRPGRFDRFVLVDVPDEKSRLKILEVHTKKVPLEKDVNLKNLAKITEDFVGADLQSLVIEAGMNALRKTISDKLKKTEEITVTKEDFQEAFKKVRPSVSPESAKVYKKIEEKYLQTVKAGVDQKVSYMG